MKKTDGGSWNKISKTTGQIHTDRVGGKPRYTASYLNPNILLSHTQAFSVRKTKHRGLNPRAHTAAARGRREEERPPEEERFSLRRWGESDSLAASLAVA